MMLEKIFKNSYTSKVSFYIGISSITTIFLFKKIHNYIYKKIEKYYYNFILEISKNISNPESCNIRPLKCSRECSTHWDTDFLHISVPDSVPSTLFESKAIEWCFNEEHNCVKLIETMTVSESLDILKKNNSKFALVFSKENKFIGVLDTPDIIRFIIRPQTTLNVCIKSVIHQCVIVNTDATMNDIISYLRTGLRYVVCNFINDYKVVTQYSVLNALLKNNEIYDQLNKTANDYNLGKNQSIITCSIENKAHSAFEKMAAYNVTSLPIVDSTGKACGIISATDLFSASDNVKLLDMNVIKFVLESRRKAGISRDVNTIVTCNKHDSIYTILRIMFHEIVNHVYILNDNSAAVGVISLVDILRVI